jgi:hypothetical protein
MAMSSRSSFKLTLFLGLLTTCLIGAYAQPLQGQEERAECGCRELRFTLQPGAGHNFVLPDVQGPVRIEVSFTLNNGGTQEPSELMYAVVNQDPASKQITWIGTSSNGSTSGSSSLKGKIIASIFGGGPGTTNATLNVVAAPTRALAINQNASTTSKPGEYVVRIYF